MSADDRQEGGDHYLRKAVPPWAVMAAWMSPDEFRGFLWGNVIKYVSRWRDKGGVEDLRKARHYLDKLIEVAGAEQGARPNRPATATADGEAGPCQPGGTDGADNRKAPR